MDDGSRELRLLAVVPHPDDEIYLMGGSLANKIEQLLIAMLSYEHTERPSAARVSRLCRELSRQATDDPLHDWAELAVPPILAAARAEERAGTDFLPIVLQDRALCAMRQGQYERASRELLKVDIVYGYPQWSAKALYEAGRAFAQLGLKDRAKAQYRQCVKKYKDEPVAKLAQQALDQMNN